MSTLKTILYHHEERGWESFRLGYPDGSIVAFHVEGVGLDPDNGLPWILLEFVHDRHWLPYIRQRGKTDMVIRDPAKRLTKYYPPGRNRPPRGVRAGDRGEWEELILVHERFAPVVVTIDSVNPAKIALIWNAARDVAIERTHRKEEDEL